VQYRTVFTVFLHTRITSPGNSFPTHALPISVCNVLLTVRYKSPVTDRAHARYADGHEMATLNATKLLLITNQPKLNLTVTLILTDTVTVIFFTLISLTPIKRLFRINERNFSRRREAWVGHFISPFADVAVLRSENTSDKKTIVHTLSLRE